MHTWQSSLSCKIFRCMMHLWLVLIVYPSFCSKESKECQHSRVDRIASRQNCIHDKARAPSNSSVHVVYLEGTSCLSERVFGMWDNIAGMLTPATASFVPSSAFLQRRLDLLSELTRRRETFRNTWACGMSTLTRALIVIVLLTSKWV